MLSMLASKPAGKSTHSIKIDDADLENGFPDEPSIAWAPGTKFGDEKENEQQEVNPVTEAQRKKFRSDRAKERLEQSTIAALMQRSFHLPANKDSWSQDWVQYMANTHPLFAIGCGDKRGFGFLYRLIVLGTSVMVGLTAVNAAIWWAEQMPTFQQQIKIPYLSLSNDKDSVSLAMVFLWTWMSFVHAFHDCVAWYGCLFSSNSSSSYEQDENTSNNRQHLFYCALWFMVWTGAGTTFAALLYNAEDYQYDYVMIAISAGIEIGISWLLWYPLVASILFSGILGCNGRLPILGGRRRDIKLAQQRVSCSSAPVTTLESLADYDQSTVAIITIDNNHKV